VFSASLNQGTGLHVADWSRPGQAFSSRTTWTSNDACCASRSTRPASSTGSGGRNGRHIYLLDRDNMGKYAPVHRGDSDCQELPQGPKHTGGLVYWNAWVPTGTGYPSWDGRHQWHAVDHAVVQTPPQAGGHSPVVNSAATGERGSVCRSIGQSGSYKRRPSPRCMRHPRRRAVKLCSRYRHSLNDGALRRRISGRTAEYGFGLALVHNWESVA